MDTLRTLSKTHSSPMFNSRISSVEKINARNIYLTNRIRSIRCQSSPQEVDEKELVSTLNSWNLPSLRGRNLDIIKEAEHMLQKKINREDPVEQKILERKTKQRLKMSCQSGKLEDMSIGVRMMERHQEEQNREKLRYYKGYEEQLEDTYSRLKKEHKEAREDIEAVYIKIFSIREKLKEEEVRLKETLAVLKLEKKKEVRPVKGSGAELAEYMSRTKFRKVSKIETKKEYQIKKNQILNDIKETEQQIKPLEEDCERIRRELEEVKAAIIKHFQNLLMDGRDTRSQGLMWIVKKLWDFGVKVTPDMFPPFLDDEAVHCVLFLAQKSYEADQLSNNSEFRTGNRHSLLTPKYDRWNGIHDRINQLKSRTERKIPNLVLDSSSKEATIELISLPSVKTYSEEASFLNPEVAEQAKIERHIKDLRSLVELTQKAEMQRLMQECLLNRYEMRYKCQMKTLLSAIVGTDTVDRHMASISKDQKKLLEKLAQTKTYHFNPRKRL